MKPYWGKCTNKRQLSNKQTSRWAQKGNGIRENNDSSMGGVLISKHEFKNAITQNTQTNDLQTNQPGFFLWGHALEGCPLCLVGHDCSP